MAHRLEAQQAQGADGSLDDPVLDLVETVRAKLRSKVEHAFRVLKCQFGYRKTRYRGRAKNAHHLATAFALVDLNSVRRLLLAT